MFECMYPHMLLLMYSVVICENFFYLIPKSFNVKDVKLQGNHCSSAKGNSLSTCLTGP